MFLTIQPHHGKEDGDQKDAVCNDIDISRRIDIIDNPQKRVGSHEPSVLFGIGLDDGKNI